MDLCNCSIQARLGDGKEDLTMQPEYSADEIPNAETLEAMGEIEEIIKTGSGQRFTGSTEDFFKMLMESDD